MHTTSERRHNDWRKAKRKQNISRHVYGFDWYQELHKYDKGKIHCSCGLCSCKTNNKVKRNGHSYGPIRNWSMMDLRRVHEMDDQERCYFVEGLADSAGLLFFLKVTPRVIYRPLNGRRKPTTY